MASLRLRLEAFSLAPASGRMQTAGQAREEQSSVDAHMRCSNFTHDVHRYAPPPPPRPNMLTQYERSANLHADLRGLAGCCRRAVAAVSINDLPNSAIQLIASYITRFPKGCAPCMHALIGHRLQRACSEHNVFVHMLSALPHRAESEGNGL